MPASIPFGDRRSPYGRGVARRHKLSGTSWWQTSIERSRTRTPVPAATANVVARQLSRDGYVERGYVGASLTDIEADDRAASRPAGALVAALVVGAPAARAGVRPGDVIRAIDDEPIAGAADFIRAVIKAGSGQVLRLSILRGGRTVTVAVPAERRRS